MHLSPQEILAALRALPPSARDDRLRAIPDDAVRRDVESLLAIEARYPDPPEDTPLFGEPVESWPDCVGPFALERELGRGGVGRVFLSTDPGLGRQCAIKILPPRPHDPARCERFQDEARILASLRHPNIAVAYTFGTYRGWPYLAIEYLSGGTLRDRLERGRPSLADTCAIGVQAADALAAAHRAGVVHRDLKPTNIMFSDAGTVKLVDFGLACSAGRSASADRALTGSFGYGAPEQMQGLPADHRSDAWAFGCILYECLTGRPAFAGRTGMERLDAVRTTEPDWTAFPGDVPEVLRVLVRRLLVRNPARRLGDFERVATILRAVTTPPPRRRPARAGARALVAQWALPLLVSLSLLGLLVMDAGERRGERVPTEDQLTFSGEVIDVAISPDGARVAFVTDPPALVVQEVESGAQITVCAMGRIKQPQWSTDGRELFFTGDPTTGGGGLSSFVADPTTGTFARVGPPLFRGSSASPDGSRLVGIVFRDGALPVTSVLDRDAGTTTPLDIEPVFPLPPAVRWSPVADLLLLYGIEKGETYPSLWVHSLASGRGFQILEQPSLIEPVWSPDGCAIVFREDESLRALRVDPQTGLPMSRPRTVLGRFTGGRFALAGTAADLQVAYCRGRSTANLWWIETTSPDWSEHTAWQRLTHGTFRDAQCKLDPSGDRVVFVRGAGKTHDDVYTVDLATGIETRLTTSGTRKGWPAWSPDGQQVVYAEAGTGLRLLDVARGDDRLLAQEAEASYVYWPREGPLFFQRCDDRHLNYRMLDIDRGTETPLVAAITGGTMFQAGILPDASKIAVAGNRGFGDDVRVWLIDRLKGTERLVYDEWAAPFAWCPQGRSLYLITDDPAYDTAAGSVLLRADTVAGTVERILQCPGPAAGWSSITMSDDCRRIVCSIRDTELDAWLIRGVSL